MGIFPLEKTEYQSDHSSFPPLDSTSSYPEKDEDAFLKERFPFEDLQDPMMPSSTDRQSDSFQTKFFNMLYILALLVAFMFLASWALKRMMKNRMTHLNTGSNIKVLETRYLSPRATLYLIETHEKTFLIAESPTSVTLLTSFPLQSENTYTEKH